MNQITVNERHGHICAFCKHWYDVTNQHISPKFPKINIWEYDSKAKCMCMVRNVEMRGFESCSKFECKL